ncbi:hypothetical protein LIER_04757 [Lithospermum erythrorhizon]|uniref:Retrotransposon Copia-like N-terminal domain-containing protein n=1 Tax=Lithospermum erythrorhizon TaxID=34254 RepID=A0AAV3NY54_LITER
MSIVTVVLTENNYVIWSRAVKMALCAKEKLGFIDGRFLEPELTSPLYDRWKRIDYMLEREITSLSQGSMSVVAYFSKLKRLQEMEVVVNQWKCEEFASMGMCYQNKRPSVSWIVDTTASNYM